MNYEVEDIFDRLKQGRISDMDAEWELRRVNNSSCMRSNISSIVRDVEYGRFDAYDASREFERRQAQCDYNRRQERQAEEDYWGD